MNKLILFNIQQCKLSIKSINIIIKIKSKSPIVRVIIVREKKGPQRDKDEEKQSKSD